MKYAIALVFVLFLTGCVGLESNFTVEVTGTPGLRFQGNYMVVAAGGQSVSRSVEGSVPASYDARGAIISAVFQKQTESGLLAVAIRKGGSVVSQSDTTASYGVVSVATP